MRDDNVTPLDGRKPEPPRKPSALEDFGRALEARIHAVAEAVASAAVVKQAAEVERLKRRVAWLEANAARRTIEPLKDSDNDADHAQ